MAKNEQQEAFEKLLSATLTRTIDFVKFAEAKNAALLTFSSAWILAGITLASNPQLQEWKTVFVAGTMTFVIAAATSICSFLPKTNLAKLHADPEQSKSLLYFGDIASFGSAGVYKERVNTRYMPPENMSATQAYLDDLAVQIHVNSKRATEKFNFFNIGARVSLAGISIITTPIWHSVFLIALKYIKSAH